MTSTGCGVEQGSASNPANSKSPSAFFPILIEVFTKEETFSRPPSNFSIKDFYSS